MSTFVLDCMQAVYTGAQSLQATTLASVTVVFGPRVAAESDPERLFVGVDIDPSQGLAAEFGNIPVGDQGQIDTQTCSILCVAEAWGGDTDILARMTRSVAIYESLRPLLRPGVIASFGSPMLQTAFLGAGQVFNQQTSKGAYSGVAFRVECVARPSLT